MSLTNKKYKIKISSSRTLGPLDLERIRALIMKGRIQGNEPASAEPYQTWLPISSYPELSELILKKMEADQSKNKQTPAPADNPDLATKTMVQSERTKTLANTEVEHEEEGSFGIPTLLNIPRPQEAENPDLEKTKIDVSGTGERGLIEREEGTKILSPDHVELVLQKYAEPTAADNRAATHSPPKKALFGLGKQINPDDYVTEDGGRRLLTKNTAALLAIGILLLAYLSTMDEETEKGPSIIPRYHTFPYIEVNNPPRLGNVAQQALSTELTEKGKDLIQRETPSAYIRAIKFGFYLAVGRNPQNYEARALLASSYMRMSEVVPRNTRLFETLEKLLFPAPPQNYWAPEYAVARAEYYILLNRVDQAQEIIDANLKFRPTAELLYQKANISYIRRDFDSALAAISKTVPPESTKANPRHLLLYATLLEKKGQKDAAKQALSRLMKESPNYGPGILHQAEAFFKNNKPKEAKAAIQKIVSAPYLLDRVQLGDLFMLTARFFEASGDNQRALLFALAAKKIHYDQSQAEDLVYRIKAKMPATKKAYTFILTARQKEQSRQIEQAINNYVRALEANRNDPTAYILLARLYESRGEVNEAIDRYRKALNTPKHPIEAALNLARIYTDRYELKEAKDYIGRAAAMNTHKDQVNYYRGVLLLKEKRQELAMPLFEQALDARSRLPALYIQMGQLEAEKNNQKGAEFYYSMALRYDPLNPQATLGVALARFHLDSPSRAISFLKDKLALQPNSAPIMTNLAVIFLRSGDQDSGKNYLQNAIRSDSKYAEAFRLLGNLTKEEGDRADNHASKRLSYRYALASYEMYSKLTPNDPTGFKATGDLYFEIRDLGAAAKNYHRVLELTPNHPDVRLRLAQISRNGGDIKEALKLIDEEIAINPRSDAALVEKGNIFMAKREFNTAASIYTQAAKINEKNPDALFGLGVVHHLQGGYDNALSLFHRVIKLDPLKADVYWQMGMIYQKQNNRARALQAFTNFKGIVRDPKEVAKANEKIKELSK